MKQVLFSISLVLSTIGVNAQLFINEISQGSAGRKEYVEFVVAGTRTCGDSTMDLRGIIFDDNAGWYGTASFNPGSFRFGNNSNWSAVPYGSIIVVYNSADKNASITLPDDPTDSNHDYVYIIPDSSSYLDINTAHPSALNSMLDYSMAPSGTWFPSGAAAVANTIELDDSTDVFNIINPAYSTTSAAHSIGWGSLTGGGTQVPVIQFAGVAAGGVNLYNTDSLPALQTSWAVGSASATSPNDETPGAGNTSANANWINNMRTQVSSSAPTAPGAISGPSSICPGTTVTYSIAPVPGATSYKWNIPGGWSGGSKDTSIVVTVNNPGIISVEAINACGNSLPASLSATLVAAPVALPILGNSSVCVGSQETYSVPPAGPASILWTIPAGWSNVNNGNAITCNVGNAGGFISVSVTNVCGVTATTVLPVSVNSYVTPAVSISTSKSTVCSGAPVTFNASTVNGGPTPQYTWQVNGMPLGISGSSFTTSSLQSGDSVSVILTSSEQCVTTNGVSSNQISMNVLPSVATGITINALPGMMICKGTTVNFVSSITGGGSHPGYLWYKNGMPIPGATSANYSTGNLNNGDVIYAALISSAVCPSKDTTPANSMVFVVNPLVTPSVRITASHTMPIPAGATVTFTATYSGGGANPGFQWLKNGKAIPFETKPAYTASNLKSNDTISVRMTSNEPCPTNTVVTSNEIRITNAGNTGVSNTTGNWYGTLNLYPNPNNGRFTIDVDWEKEHTGERVQVEVLNMMGQTVYSATLQPGSAHWNANVSLEGAVSGMYQLKLHTETMQVIRPILIQQ